MEEIRLNIETSEEFSKIPAAEVQPKTAMNIDPLKAAQSVTANIPYGQTVSQGLGVINQIGGLSKLSPLATITVALGVIKMLHDVTSKYVKEVRQSNELQRRAGFKRRDE